MNTPDDRSSDVSRGATTVSFGDAFAQSPHFDTVFGEGMALVERAANYLDGAGRKQSRRLAPPVSTAYATESMRMTTRLLELASWLLIQRALKNGEISTEEAERLIVAGFLGEVLANIPVPSAAPALKLAIAEKLARQREAELERDPITLTGKLLLVVLSFLFVDLWSWLP